MKKPSAARPLISIIIPASNEAALIGQCLQAVLASESVGGSVEIIVVVNGSTDKTAAIATGFTDQANALGWKLQVLEIAQGGKMNALNAGDNAAGAAARIYLDADVKVSPTLLAQIGHKLDCEDAIYTSGRVQIADATTTISRAYKRVYRRVPFMTIGVPGCGLFAVNRAGRARWGEFPDIISDDTFVRLSFAPSERQGAAAMYEWPIVEGLSNLVRVRRRQNAGVEEIATRFPDLLKNDDKPRFRIGQVLGIALTDPFGFAVYFGVALVVRLTRSRGGKSWSRGR